MNHDDETVQKTLRVDIILVGVSRTSKTPTSIYLANKGLKTSNIPLVNEMNIPSTLLIQVLCVVGLITEAERLFDKRNMSTHLENEASDYTNLEKIRDEVDQSKKIFKKNKWPVIDATENLMKNSRIDNQNI